jgi:hypothetical protein
MPDSTGAAPASWARRIGWLVLLWSASVLALGVVAAIIRVMMTAAGLTV